MCEMLGDFLGALFGAIVGIPCGFLLNYWWSHKETAGKAAQLKVGMRDTMRHNLYLLGEIQRHLEGNSCPTFNVDLTMMDATASLKYEILDDDGLCRTIDNIRYELAHIARQVDARMSLEFNPTSRIQVMELPGGSMYHYLQPQLKKLIIDQIQPLRVKMTNVQTLLPE